MESKVIFEFHSAQTANRFLNTLKNWSVADVDARFFDGNCKVAVAYQYQTQGFDSTLAELDDLAANMGGWEVSS
ncbi:hypothetical protein OE749_01520 [Aestuariibacter sp. AA17]|uniref:Uncharacterized protein n=1 Tax=Fluctibacter corallii TaxID=2984329 RepID=A0ABT3A3X5_9ALTE|nr:hypothetical protein [Aestuariibacter sp. AA17]MCV2883375.1 hypothetical protein [Aestuariibacter sp. AA17]